MSPRIYNVYASFYHVFEGLFRRRLAKAIAALPIRPHDELLDVGVGTGFSLSHYPPSLRVTGIDLSAAMLRQAQRKLPDLRPGASRSMTRLQTADAQNLPFPDGSFDIVLLSHVISAVPDPAQCMAEALRVASSHSHIMLVNHFQSDHRLLRLLERVIDPICRRLGWQTSLSLKELLAPWSVVNVPETRSIFQIVLLQKTPRSIRVLPVRLPEFSRVPCVRGT